MRANDNVLRCPRSTKPFLERYLAEAVVVFAACLVILLWIGVALLVRQERERAIETVKRENANLARAFAEHTYRTLNYVDQLSYQITEQYQKLGKAFDMHLRIARLTKLTEPVKIEVMLPKELAGKFKAETVTLTGKEDKATIRVTPQEGLTDIESTVTCARREPRPGLQSERTFLMVDGTLVRQSNLRMNWHLSFVVYFERSAASRGTT